MAKKTKMQNEHATAERADQWLDWLGTKYTVHETSQREVAGGVFATAWVTPLDTDEKTHEHVVQEGTPRGTTSA